MLDLLRPVDSLVHLIQELALRGHFGDGLEAHPSHCEEKQRDQHVARKKLGMNRGLDAGDPPNEVPDVRAGQEKARNPFLPARRRNQRQSTVRLCGFLLRHAGAPR
jgi:hypothetical protein